MTTDLKNFCQNIEQNDTLLCTLDEDSRQAANACHAVPAQFKCGTCGATTDAPKNVCQPVQLPEIHWLGDGADNLNLEGHCR